MADEPRREYLQTFFRVQSPMLGLPPRFGVVTAFDPHGRGRPAQENEAADRALGEELTRAGLAPFRVTGGSVDWGHVEPGYGFAAASPERIRPVSRRWRQAAFYWVSDGVVYVVNTDGRALHRVDLWSARLRA